MPSQAILLVDDDQELTYLVQRYLQDAGYLVEIENNGEKAVARIAREQPRAVVLDVLMPEADGLSVCRRIREEYTGPIIMMTALGDDIDRVAGLEIGADMYLSKPVQPRVLLAHLRACLRRNETLDSAVGDKQLLNSGELQLDLAKRLVRFKGKNVTVTSGEFELLYLLAEEVGSIVSRDALYQKLFNMPYDGIDRNVDLRISRLRKKLSGDTQCSQVIKTVRGAGYLLVV